MWPGSTRSCLMKTHIALLRGINVLGKNVLPMAELSAILESIGGKNVQTYIQSGNAVFQHKDAKVAKLSGDLSAEIAKRRGFAPHVLMLEAKDLAKVVKANPFPEAVVEPKSLHVFFLDSKPARSRLTLLPLLQTKTERFELRGTAFYLHTPDGFGRSKLAANVERKLGVPATARNWRTVCRLLEMAIGCA